MAYKLISSVAILVGVTASGAAVAGGYVAPTVEPIAPVVVPTATSDWAGGYVGGALGYSFGGDDAIGLEEYTGDTVGLSEVTLGQVDVKGANLSLHAGYRWQRNNWVFGPELSIEGGSVDATSTLAANDFTATGTEIESKVNYIASLRFKTGYAVNPETLIYGTIGAAHGDFDYTSTLDGVSETVGYTDSAWTVGLGAERKLSEKLSLFAEWEFRQFGKTGVSFTDQAPANTRYETKATPEHHNVRVGVNFRF